MNVFLTGTESAKGIIAVRTLGKNGLSITTSSHRKNPAARFSKYSSEHFVYPNPSADSDSFIESITSYLKENKHDVLIPLHSRETEIISKYKSKLEPLIRVPVVGHKKFSKLNNKKHLARLASDLGIRIPKTIFLSNINQLESIEINYPVVIKLNKSQGNKGLSYANNKQELISRYIETISKYSLKEDDFPIIQEFIRGYGLGTSVLYNKGKLKAFFTHRRIRENPPSGGPSTCRIGVRNRATERTSKKLMDYVKWHGIAMLEFKIEYRTKEPYLLEVNPRFWGSMYQAIVSGADFPYWLYLIAMGEKLDFAKEINLGIKTRFLPLDLLALKKYLLICDNKISLLNSYIPRRNTKYDLESFDDFSPTFNYYIEKFRGR